MAIDKDAVARLCWRIGPALARIIGIVAGMLIMGVRAFLTFYMLHLFMNSINHLFALNMDKVIARNEDDDAPLDREHIRYLMVSNGLLSLLGISVYLFSIMLIQRYVSPGLLDPAFSYLYALALTVGMVKVHETVVELRGQPVLRFIILKGAHVTRLILIASFVLSTIEPIYLPWVWLVNAILISLSIFTYGEHLLRQNARPSDEGPACRTSLWQEIFRHSARKTRNRAVMVLFRGMISPVFGPLAGFALQVFNLNNQRQRAKYTELVARQSIYQWLRLRLPERVVAHLRSDRPFQIVMILALAILVAIGFLRGRIEDIYLFGLIVVAAKMLSVSARIIVLEILTAE
jgi:hypothetical protein